MMYCIPRYCHIHPLTHDVLYMYVILSHTPSNTLCTIFRDIVTHPLTHDVLYSVILSHTPSNTWCTVLRDIVTLPPLTHGVLYSVILSHAPSLIHVLYSVVSQTLPHPCHSSNFWQLNPSVIDKCWLMLYYRKDTSVKAWLQLLTATGASCPTILESSEPMETSWQDQSWQALPGVMVPSTPSVVSKATLLQGTSWQASLYM